VAWRRRRHRAGLDLPAAARRGARASGVPAVEAR